MIGPECRGAVTVGEEEGVDHDLRLVPDQVIAALEPTLQLQGHQCTLLHGQQVAVAGRDLTGGTNEDDLSTAVGEGSRIFRSDNLKVHE